MTSCFTRDCHWSKNHGCYTHVYDKFDYHWVNAFGDAWRPRLKRFKNIFHVQNIFTFPLVVSLSNFSRFADWFLIHKTRLAWGRSGSRCGWNYGPGTSWTRDTLANNGESPTQARSVDRLPVYTVFHWHTASSEQLFHDNWNTLRLSIRFGTLESYRVSTQIDSM